MATSVETPDIEIRATIGVDTHADVHVAVALDQLGRRLGAIEIPTTTAGFNQLVDWASHFGVVEQFGIEGTSSYGAGLCRWLQAQGLVVVEVDRPDRTTRRSKGKSDPIDAEAAARTVLAGEARGTPKSQDGPVEQIRVLRVAKRSAVKNQTMAANQMRALVTTAPQELRDELRDLSTAELVEVAAAFRFADDPDTIVHTTKYTLRELARRYQQLTEQLERLTRLLDDLVATTAPELVNTYGVGTDTAGQLLVTAGDNPDRLESEAAFAHLCATAPLPATSGKQQTRHRLNHQGGDRQANAALHRIAIVRLCHEQRTQDYIAKRQREGKSKKEAIRCVKRYIARQVYKILRYNPHLAPA
jgi:transposase